MSATPKSLTLGLVFCGVISGAVMSNLYSEVSNYRIAYLRCHKLLEKAQKHKLESFSLKYRLARRKAFYCITRELSKLSKVKNSNK